jgi:hypothetical protein
MLDRPGIRRLMLTHSQAQLCFHFGISKPTLRKFLRGVEPAHESLTEYINRKVNEMLKRPDVSQLR